MTSHYQNFNFTPKPYIYFFQSEHIQSIKIENPSPTIDIGLIYKKDKYMCTAIREFIALRYYHHTVQIRV
ncbi:LysR family transcriptional regulator [Bacillus thuringiensis]|nr:LysR family transcriptional regulator [Bacillus thuringiensis]